MKYYFGGKFFREKIATKEHCKYAAIVLIIVAISVACIASIVDRMSKKEADATIGVMIKLADVAKKQEAFSGAVFETRAIEYGTSSEEAYALVLENGNNNTFLASLGEDYKMPSQAELSNTKAKMQEILAARREKLKKDSVSDAIYAQAAVQVFYPGSSFTSGIFTYNIPYIDPIIADPNGNYEDIGEFLLTGYCPCPICCGAYSNMEHPTTASGTLATVGRTIAGPPQIPFGTQLVINGQIYTVEDRGGAIVGNHIDIFFATHQQALDFGRRTAQVYKVLD